MLIGTKITPLFTHARYKSMISMRLARYTQRRSPLVSPRAAKARAMRLLRASISPKVYVDPAHSSASWSARWTNVRSNQLRRFIDRVALSTGIYGPLKIAQQADGLFIHEGE